MISFKQKGDFSNVYDFFKKSVKITDVKDLENYARACIEKLKAVTPKDSGLTAESWEYKIEQTGKNKKTVTFLNTNVQNGALVAMLVEHGHIDISGNWIAGKSFIEPTLVTEFLSIVKDTWKELTKL